MAFADTNRVALGLKEESTWGEWPGGSLEAVRYTSESFGQEQNTTQSSEVRDDRQIPDIIRTGISAQGGFEGELSYDVTAFEKLLKGLLGAESDFGTAPAEESGTIDADSANNEFSSTDVDLSQFSVGDWIRTTGFSNAANNGYFQVTSSATDTLGVTGNLTDESGSGDETIQGSAVMRNGTSEYSFSLEKQFKDLSLAARILGYRTGSVELSLSPESIVTYSVSGQGKQVSDTEGTDLTDESSSLDFSTLATVNDAAANDVMSTVDGIGELLINRDDPLTSVTVQSMTVTPQTSLRQQQALRAGIGPAGIGIGSFSISGSITAYFEQKALLEEYLLFRDVDIAVVTKDGAGNAYLWDFPAVKFGGDGLPKGSGQDEDAIISLDMNAKRSTRNGLDYMVAVHKFAG